MKIFLQEIKTVITKNLNPEDILLIDNSNLHAKHKSFDPKKIHLKLVIKSKQLKKMNQIEAHRKIFSILKNEMKNKIHALEIEIN